MRCVWPPQPASPPGAGCSTLRPLATAALNDFYPGTEGDRLCSTLSYASLQPDPYYFVNVSWDGAGGGGEDSASAGSPTGLFQLVYTLFLPCLSTTGCADCILPVAAPVKALLPLGSWPMPLLPMPLLLLL